MNADRFWDSLLGFALIGFLAVSLGTAFLIWKFLVNKLLEDS